MNKQELAEQLARHEGVKLKPYKDTVGKLTIGIGRNLDDKGITELEALNMLVNDIAEFAAEVSSNIRFFNALNDARQNVLVNMAFNMGIGGLLSFSNMLSALSYGHYQQAEREMLDSKWASQVGYRARELGRQMRTGEYQ